MEDGSWRPEGVKEASDVSEPVRARKAPFYHDESYWEKEEAVEIRTDRVALTYYRKAGAITAQ